MMQVRRFLALAGLIGCGGEGESGPVTDGGEATGGGESDAGPVGGGASDSDAASSTPDAGLLDPGELPSLRAVSGDLVFVERLRAGDAATGHIYSVQTDGALRQRLSATPGAWLHPTVGPDKRYVAAIRLQTADGVDAEDAEDARGEVWILDVKSRDAYPISPAGCDARGGGVGFRDEVQVMFSAACDGQPGAVYMAARDDRTRQMANLLPIAAGDEPVREVFPAVGTSIFAFVADHEICSGGECFTKPQLWIGDFESDIRCQVTDGDLGMDDLATVTGAEKRLGDHSPTFSVDLKSLTFSRNVAGKGVGPTGHHDPFRIGVDLDSLYGRRPTCAEPGTLTNLGDRVVADAYPDEGGEPASELQPQSATAGGLLSGAVLLVARRPEESPPFGVVYVVDRMGGRVALSAPGAEAVSARWITPAFDTSGIR